MVIKQPFIPFRKCKLNCRTYSVYTSLNPAYFTNTYFKDNNSFSLNLCKSLLRKYFQQLTIKVITFNIHRNDSPFFVQQEVLWYSLNPI